MPKVHLRGLATNPNIQSFVYCTTIYIYIREKPCHVQSRYANIIESYIREEE